MAEEPEADLDSIVDRLLEVRGSRPGQQVQLEEYEIRFLCKKAREIFIQQPILLELEAPIKVSIPFYRKSCDCFYGFILILIFIVTQEIDLLTRLLDMW